MVLLPSCPRRVLPWASETDNADTRTLGICCELCGQLQFEVTNCTDRIQDAGFNLGHYFRTGVYLLAADLNYQRFVFLPPNAHSPANFFRIVGIPPAIYHNGRLGFAARADKQSAGANEDTLTARHEVSSPPQLHHTPDVAVYYAIGPRRPSRGMH
jgi:hypothetical protein